MSEGQVCSFVGIIEQQADLFLQVDSFVFRSTPAARLTINTSLTDLRRSKTTEERDRLVRQFPSMEEKLKRKREDTNPALRQAVHQNHEAIQARAEQLTQRLARKSAAVMEEVSFTTPPSAYRHFVQERQEEGYGTEEIGGRTRTLEHSSIDELQRRIRQNKIRILQLEDENAYASLLVTFHCCAYLVVDREAHRLLTEHMRHKTNGELKELALLTHQQLKKRHQAMYQTSPPSRRAAFVSSSPDLSPIFPGLWRSAPHAHSSPHVTTPPRYMSPSPSHRYSPRKRRCQESPWSSSPSRTTSTRPSTTPRALWEDPVTSPHLGSLLGSFDEGFQSPPRPSGAPSSPPASMALAQLLNPDDVLSFDFFSQ